MKQQSHKNTESKQQIYLQRINQLHTNIKNWLQDEPFILEISNIDIIEVLGNYQVAQLSIKTKNGETLAKLLSKGTAVLLGEGLIEMEGKVGTESIIYMLKGGLMITDRYGKNRPMYKGINENGWYWIEDSYRNKAHLMNQALIKDLITLVSDYEF